MDSYGSQPIEFSLVYDYHRILVRTHLTLFPEFQYNTTPTLKHRMSVTKQQIDVAMDKVWDDIQSTVGPLTVEEFKVMLAKVLFPEPESDSEKSDSSSASKRGRKKGPMSEDAKAAMVAKRKATLAAKAAQPVESKPEEPKVAAIAVKMVKPKKVKEDKPKMSKEDRSAAAKARWESKTEEEKEAIKANLAAARAAKKAAKAE